MDTEKAPRKSPIRPFMAGLALGALAGMLGMYLHQSDRPVPQPIRTKAIGPVDCGTTEQKSAEPTVLPTKDAKDFEFYGVLEEAPVSPARPDLEQPPISPPMEPDQPASTSPATTKPFYLQIASFKSAADADALKARIVLAGEPATVVTTDIAEKGTHYRVRVGPFANKADLSRAKAQLAQSSIDLQNAFVVR
jgi:cell division protein FtsN